MRRRKRERDEDEPKHKPRDEDAPEPLKIPHDPVNEAAIIAGAYAIAKIRPKLLLRARPDAFQVREHALAWAAFAEAERRKLTLDLPTIEQLSNADVARAVAQIIDEQPGGPANVEWHLGHLLWDAARARAANGPVPAFLAALGDTRAEPEKVRALARSILMSFDGGFEDRRFLHDRETLVREQMMEIERRVSGQAIYPFGLPGLDCHENGQRRLVPGAAPGLVTLVAALSGSGKSTLAANLVLGLAGWRFNDEERVYVKEEPGRQILWGAWEMQGGMTLELLAIVSLGWSRTESTLGIGRVATQGGRVVLEERMHAISKNVRFMANPFRRTSGERKSNDRNLDLVHGYIADSGCDVFVGDLWRRCLVDGSPEAEEEALFRQQAICEETRCHGMLLHQLRLKDLEGRIDKRPTREGVKGSAAYVEVVDAIIAPHRPAIWKKVEDDIVEILILKQRYGVWPLAVEMRWDPDRGQVWGGKTIVIDRAEASDDELLGKKVRFGRGRQ